MLLHKYTAYKQTVLKWMRSYNMNEINVTSAKYVLHNNINDHIDAVIDGETISVPLAPGNRHYDEIMRQVEAGTLTIADAD